MSAPIWNNGKKWMGNLLPLLCVLPCAIIGVFLMLRAKSVTAPGIGLCLLGLFVGWVAVNFFGLWANTALRSAIGKKVLPKLGKNASDGLFVGFATPAYVGALDAHEDLGYLFVEAEAVEFHGESHHVSIDRGDVKRIGRRPNIHTFLGLGGWISVEALVKGKQIRLLVEPREANTLLGNRKHARALRLKLEAWKEKKALEQPPEPVT